MIKRIYDRLTPDGRPTLLNYDTSVECEDHGWLGLAMNLHHGHKHAERHAEVCDAHVEVRMLTWR